MSVQFLLKDLYSSQTKHLSPDFSPFAHIPPRHIVAHSGTRFHVTSDHELIADFVDHSLNNLALFQECQSVITISMQINVST